MRVEAAVAAVAIARPSAPASAPIEVWVPDPAGGFLDKLAQQSGGPKSDDTIVRDAYTSAQKVLTYVQREFGRNSYDGAGATLKLRVHADDPLNAYWYNDEGRIHLGDGDGATFSPLGGAADVVAHEFFHGVVDHEVKLDYNEGQEGALHESFADVLGSGVDGNWQIGEKVYTPDVKGDALRDLSKLEYTDWRTFPAWQDEVHAMSEVPSHAAYLVAKTLGDSAARKIWYNALTDHLHDRAGFAGARDATISAARAIYGAVSKEAQAVFDAWTAVGIDALTPKERPPLSPTAAVAATLAAALTTSRPRLY